MDLRRLPSPDDLLILLTVARLGRFNAAAEALGGLDGLVHAAGRVDVAPIGDLTAERWDAVVDVNLRAHALLTHPDRPDRPAAGRPVLVRGGSRIPDDLLKHNVELGVLSYDPQEPQLQSTVVYLDELAFVVPPGHPLASADEVSIRQLGAESFVAPSDTE